MTVRVEIDPQRCMGSGNCVYVTAKVFDLDAQGIAILIGDPESDLERVQHAADTCPTSAITLTGD